MVNYTEYNVYNNIYIVVYWIEVNKYNNSIF